MAVLGMAGPGRGLRQVGSGLGWVGAGRVGLGQVGSGRVGGFVKKGNPFEEGGGEDEQEKGLGRTRTDEDKDEKREEERTREDCEGRGQMRTKPR